VFVGLTLALAAVGYVVYLAQRHDRIVMLLLAGCIVLALTNSVLHSLKLEGMLARAVRAVWTWLTRA
jgi:hypothetical protein